MSNEVEFDTAEEVERFLFAETELGIRVEQFFEDACGKYFKARCEELVRKFTRLALSPLTDAKALEQARAEAYGAQAAMRILVDAITNGRNSEQQLKDRDDSEESQH